MGLLQRTVTSTKSALLESNLRTGSSATKPLLNFFVLDSPMRSLVSSIVDFVPCDRQLQRVHKFCVVVVDFFSHVEICGSSHKLKQRFAMPLSYRQEIYNGISEKAWNICFSRKPWLYGFEGLQVMDCACVMKDLFW